MIAIDVPKDALDRVTAALQDQQASFTTVVEERFFGDAQVVTVILENSETVINIIASSVAIWSSLRVARVTAPNGSAVDLTKMSADQVRKTLQGK